MRNPIENKIESHYSCGFQFNLNKDIECNRLVRSFLNPQKQSCIFRCTDRVKLKSVKSLLTKYLHEQSSSMLQRIMVALALMFKPRLIIAIASYLETLFETEFSQE